MVVPASVGCVICQQPHIFYYYSDINNVEINDCLVLIGIQSKIVYKPSATEWWCAW